MKKMTDLLNNGLEIAIIGIAGRFPGANTIEAFWQNLSQGRESITVYSDEDLLKQGVNEALLKKSNYVKAAAKLEDVDQFDAEFFGFNAREAEIIDPQHRLFLECAWEALENAGYDSQKYEGAIGVFGGAGMNGYLFNVYSQSKNNNNLDPYQLFIASDKDFLTTRVSYKLNLDGPSVNVQTACSTSLVAVHLACQSLLSGECDMALAGGVAISQQMGYLYQEGGIYSPDGHCRAFDADAKGTVSGNGVGLVVLKRLEDALTEGDNILAVIKGSAINNDGAQKVSYTAPSLDSQTQVIKAAQHLAEVEPESISYIEAHGTGTALGDPIEIAALTQAFRVGTDKTGFCALGSVKTNIGHLDTAAGIASLIKTTLALKNRQIPPSLHFKQPNPQIDFTNSPFYVNTTLSKWQSNGIPRRAGVSSFGIGGTNVHVVLEESPLEEAEGDPPNPRPNKSEASFGFPFSKGDRRGISQGGQAGGKSYLLPLSAKTATALEKARENLVNHLKEHPELNLGDVAYTLQVGRRDFEYRGFIVCQDHKNAIKQLESSFLTHSSASSSHRPVTFLFSGQGSQYVGMGKELYETEPIFKQEVDRCCDLLQSSLGWDLRGIIFEEQGVGDLPLPPLTNTKGGSQQATLENSYNLRSTIYAQPALFIIEYALAKLWMSWGIEPDVMMGHSIGEYVAATLAKVFSLENALKIVAVRGKLMQKCDSGKMLSVALGEAEIQPYLGEDLSLAVVNAPQLCVVSGTETAIAQLQKDLESQNIACRPLHTSHAFHSAIMEPILKEFEGEISRISLHYPQIPFISNVSGTWIKDTEATDPLYWVNHLRRTVRFAEGIAELAKEPQRIFLEVGPGKTLSTLTQQQLGLNSEQVILTSLRHPKEEQSDIAFILNTLGKLWQAGVEINWSGFYGDERRYRVPLPTYPFERKRYWIEAQFEDPKEEAIAIYQDLEDWFYVPSWERDIASLDIDWESLRETRACWLIFLDSQGIGANITDSLTKAGQEVLTVTPGQEFAEPDYRCFTINPNKREDYQALAEDLKLRQLIPNFIVHLWNIETENKELTAYQEQGFYSLLWLGQTLIPLCQEVFVVTQGLYDVVGQEELIPEKMPVVGLCQVINQEYPQVSCRNIDIEAIRGQEAGDRLLTEFLDPQKELIVAYRGAYRWHQTFKRMSLKEPKTKKIQLRKGGNYLILGELVSSLGGIFAQQVAATGDTTILLVSQEKLPKREEWDKILTNKETQETIFQQIHQIQALEAKGATCLVFSPETNLNEIMGQVDKLHGVFYATPMSSPLSAAPIQLLERSHGEYNFQTKAQGLYPLAVSLQDKKLDFVLVQSSLSAVLGGLGLGAYSAANRFLDAFVHQQNQISQTPWISVNWDACLSEEDKQKAMGLGSSLIPFALTPQEVTAVIERILASGLSSQIIVSKGDLHARLKGSTQVKLSPKTTEETSTEVNQNAAQHQRPNLANEYVAPRNEIENAIANIWQEILGIQPIGVNDNFFDLGGHSLLAIQALSRLKETFQVELSMGSLLYEAPTIAGITAIIEQNKEETEDLEALSEVLAEIQSLSSEEIKAQLNEE
ncbi:polyketide synthase type I [Crocosphaera subtropica ATCC 51142]|uniref:Polyketide synthase type I n=2 Tax=Crocosphaera TaxID=263510 RepID=B1WWV3_CROS5|nr:polyketide synthase type I [Crocosphaera subtropica ATCC 51142]